MGDVNSGLAIHITSMYEINYILCESSKYKYLYQGSAEMDHFSLRSGQFFKKVLFGVTGAKIRVICALLRKMLRVLGKRENVRA